MRLTTLFAVVATVVAASPVLNITNCTSIGPENGSLVIVGGNLQSESIYQRIISLAGGPDAPIVVIPTAGGEPTYNTNFSTAVAFRRFGATNVTVLHTYDPSVADTDDFIAPLLAGNGDSSMHSRVPKVKQPSKPCWIVEASSRDRARARASSEVSWLAETRQTTKS